MTTFGWDMSHYDDTSIASALDEGVSFITHKAGGDTNDQEIAAWWTGVQDLKPGEVLLGAYWVLYPGTPSERADSFVARLDATCPGWRGRPFILQVDCEIWGGDRKTLPPRADIEAFCDRLHHVMPLLRPVVYAPKWCYGDALVGLSWPLWASSYVSGTGGFRALYPGDDSTRWAAYSGQTPAILQYSSSATIGGQTTSDANAYRGTLQELTTLVAPGWSGEGDDMATISQSDFNDRMDAWWSARMDPAAADNKPRTFLRVAPWQQEVGRTGVTTHNTLFGSMLALLQKAAGEKFDSAEIAKTLLAGLSAAPVDDIVKVLETTLSEEQLMWLCDALVAVRPVKTGDAEGRPLVSRR